MQAFFIYLLKTIIYSGILFGYYHIALRNKRFHYYNRFYLLMSVALSLCLPFLQLEIWQWKSANPQVINLANIIVTNAAEHESKGFSLSLSFNDFLLLIYTLIAACLLLSFVSGLVKLIRMKKQYPSEKIGEVLFINTDLQQAPFSFFKDLFWKNSIDITDETGKQIFRHELTHIEQKHSSDKLFLQIITLLFWLNPFYWLIQKELSLIHEFIADEKAIDNKDAEAFALMLLQSQFGKNIFLPAQSFNYSPIKRRLRMLTSSSKTSHSYARRILALPVLSLTILLFAFKLGNKQETYFSHVNAPFMLVVDAGHGGKEQGATGNTDATEKDINLSIAKKIAELAPQYGITVTLTRTEDATVSLQDRMDIIKNAQPDAFLSVHVNAAPASAPNNDFEVYISKNNTTGAYRQSRLLGSSIIQSVKANFPVNAALQQSKQGIYVLDQNPYPAVIVECGYMNNAGNVEQLTTEAGVEKVANNILQGVATYANSNKQDTAISFSDTTKPKPLYILDGKEISAEDVKKINPNAIQSMNALIGEDATKPYGKKGENGVIIVTLKKKNTEADTFKPDVSMKASSDNITFSDTQQHKELIFVNEKEMSREELNTIPSNEIKVVSVWKGEEAIKKYGDKGKNGVIDVETEKDSNKQPVVYFSSAGEAKEATDTTISSPSFPGGKEAWLAYLIRNLNADIPAKHGAPAGNYTVIVSLKVSEDGSVSNVKATNDPGYGTAAEAVRVIQRGPKWIPAKQNGEAVTAIAKQPITFQLQEVK